MDWDKEIETFLDANRFRGAHRKMMKANLMKLPPDKRAGFLKKRLADFEQAPTPPVALADPRASGAVQSSNVPCEGCGGAIVGTMHYVQGSHFEDGWRRGYFCSSECLDHCFEYEHFGSPHNDFEVGDVVKLMHDTHLLTAREEDHFYPAGTVGRVVRGQRFYDGYYAAGSGGDVEVAWEYVVVDFACQGHTFTQNYVASLVFVRRG